MSMTIRDFLEENATFLSPTPGKSKPKIRKKSKKSSSGESSKSSTTRSTKSSSPSSTDVNDLEVTRLDKMWKPVAAWRDAKMVDSLLQSLHTYLGDRLVPAEEELMLRARFKPFIDGNGKISAWQHNNNEADARELVNSVVQAVGYVMGLLGKPISTENNYVHPEEDFNSLVDYALIGQNAKILLEIKSPKVLEHALPKLQRQSLRISIRSHGPQDEVVLNKVCLYMSSHKVHWLALTSHHKWIFFRLYPDPEEPYISYSNVIEQEKSTEPFRALLAMMLAAEEGLKVDSNVDKTVPLPAIEEEEEHPSDPSQGDQDQSDSYQGGGAVTEREPYLLRPRGTGPTESSELLVGWSQRVVPDTEWLSFHAVDGTDQCSPLGPGPIRLWLQRGLGQGSTGIVYEAKLDVDEHGNKPTSHSYAVKTVVKGRSGENRGSVGRLFNEFEAYRKIEQARKHGRFGHVAPCCYGLYESRSLYVLILDHEGESLDDEEWASLKHEEKTEIYKLISDLHFIGIGHGDLEPRNIVRNAEGSFKIIDFSMCSFHDCPGIKMGSWYRRGGRISGECGELKYMHMMLVDRRVKKGYMPPWVE